MAYNRPLITAFTRRKPAAAGPRLVIDGAGSVVCTALRRAEHSESLLVRLFEADGRACRARLTVGDGIKKAKEVNFVENPTGAKPSLRSGRVSLRFRPFEVKTLLVKCRGLS
jgi:alpha-mannosidase